MRRSGLAVQREPRINGKTPGLIVTQPYGPDVVIECLVKLNDPEHERKSLGKVHVCGGDASQLHSALYSRVAEKATKYRKVVTGRSYIVAVYDGGCMNFPSTALALAFSAHVPCLSVSAEGEVTDTGHIDVWASPERSASLFKLYPHLSGLIYSRWERKHYFLPNPFADTPVSADLFPFACIPEAPSINGEPAWEKRARLVDDN